MLALPSALDIHAAIIETARKQIATTRQGKALAELAPELLDGLIVCIAGNAAMSVRSLIDDAIEAELEAAERGSLCA